MYSAVVLWAVTLYNPVGGYRRFEGTYRLHSPEDSSDTFLRNVTIHQKITIAMSYKHSIYFVEHLKGFNQPAVSQFENVCSR